MDLVGAYQRTRGRVQTLTREASADELARAVPACPDWSVHDVLAHVVATPAALTRGRLPDGDINAWLDTLIAEREYETVNDLCAEWNGLDGSLGALLNGPAGLLFADLAIHEHDLRSALDRVDHEALDVDAFMPYLMGSFTGYLAPFELPPIEVHDGERSWCSGEATPGWTLLVDPWEAMRALNGRRTADELRALPSKGDAEPYLGAIAAHLPLPESSLGER